MIYGYARVSTTDQNIDRQLKAFSNVGVDNVYSDKMSGKNFDREEYQKMKKNLHKGDLLYIKSIDRLGRNYDMIIDEWRDITRNIGADIVVIDMPLLDTREKEKGLTGKFISDIVLQILSYVAETERNNIKTRQAEGIRVAKEKGIRMGRPKYELPENFVEVIKRYADREISMSDALEQTEMKKSTFFKFAKKLGYNRNKEKKNNRNVENIEYHLTGDFVDKVYYNRTELANDLKVSWKTLTAHLKGLETIIDKMGLKVEKITIQKGG